MVSCNVGGSRDALIRLLCHGLSSAAYSGA
jgi:hypothetical protein